MERIYESFEFETLEEVHKQFPLFHIDDKYDWKKESGFFDLKDGGSEGIYGKAVEDVFYSHYAKDNAMSTYDMLRMRALYRRRK